MAIRDILLLGNPLLYQPSLEVQPKELEQLQPIFTDLRDTLFDFVKRSGFGRGIAAPQIGCLQRILFIYINRKEYLMINPVLDKKSRKTFELWDDCFSFPNLLVKVKRHCSCRLRYFDRQWHSQTMMIENDFSELLQHETDHLNGILAVNRALDKKSFKYIQNNLL
jgi:peptide deformylase